MRPGTDVRRRHEESVRFGRDLARRLADEAQMIAVTLDSLADLHESLADVAGHPLAGQAGHHAASERLLAGRERAAAAWFMSISDGTYRRPGESYLNPSQ